MNQDFQDRYAHLICTSFLGLRKNDLLSLNTEEKDLDFARIVADKALKITENVVKLVITENGKVQDVIDFDPDFPPEQGRGFVMLHLRHFNKPVELSGKLLDTVVEKDDFPSLQKFGHLADPQILGRRITVPFCVVPVYEDGDPREEDITRLLESDIDASILSCNYREQYLNQADVRQFCVSGSDCSFSFIVPHDSLFPTGSIKLSGGRMYIPSTDYDKTLIAVDKASFNGVFFAEFDVFSRHQSGRFIFKNGVVESYPKSTELDRLFGYDDNLKKVGFVKAGDKFFSVVLGGSSVEVLPPETEKFPEEFNECPYCLSLILPCNLNAFFTDCDGNSKEIIRKGFFLE